MLDCAAPPPPDAELAPIELLPPEAVAPPPEVAPALPPPAVSANVPDKLPVVRTTKPPPPPPPSVRLLLPPPPPAPPPTSNWLASATLTPLARLRLAVVALVPLPRRIMVTPLASTSVLEVPLPLRSLTVATLSMMPPWRVPPLRVMALLRVWAPLLPTEMVWVTPESIEMSEVLELEEAV